MDHGDRINNILSAHDLQSRINKIKVKHANALRVLEQRNKTHNYGKLSAAAYDDENGLVDGYYIDHELSTKQNRVYVPHNTNGKAVIAYRGTTHKDNIIDKDDLSADYDIALGNESVSKRFSDADAHYQRVAQKYKDVSVTGHSLGGAQALYIGKKHNLKGQAFQPGSGLSYIKQYGTREWRREIHKNITNENNGVQTVDTPNFDILSSLSRLGSNNRQVVAHNSNYATHSSKHFV